MKPYEELMRKKSDQSKFQQGITKFFTKQPTAPAKVQELCQKPIDVKNQAISSFFLPRKSSNEEKNEFKCKICSSRFSTKSELTDHIASTHEGKKVLKA